MQFVITVRHCCAVYSTSSGSLNIIDPGMGRYVATSGTSAGFVFLTKVGPGSILLASRSFWQLFQTVSNCIHKASNAAIIMSRIFSRSSNTFLSLLAPLSLAFHEEQAMVPVSHFFSIWMNVMELLATSIPNVLEV